MSQNYQYNTIEEALRDLKEGKIVLVTDDPDRENEGDLICAAEFATRENINFMATYAKGLICTPMSAEIAVRLNFPPMVAENTDNHSTAFTVAVDHADTTTGISAEERSYTIMKCVDDQSKPEDFRRPGHVFPLISRKGGVLVRNGHTEATTDLMRLAGLKECGVCCEVMKEDGTMMRTSQLWEMAKEQLFPGETFYIGATANTFEDIEHAVGQGASYIGLGPFRYTETKKKLSPVLGLEGYRKIVQQCKEAGYKIPIFAIGGICLEDVAPLMETGITGIAVSGAIIHADDPVEETRRFINEINKY